MKFNFAALLLLASSTEATKLKSQSQMMAEIEAMSLNANMHQVSLREKTLIKTYLEVDINEFLQAEMDSELFEGISEKEKSELVGNFFHWIKQRFADNNYLQTKSKLRKTQPTIAESKTREDEKNVTDWGSGKGNHTPAHSASDKAPALAQTKSVSPTAAESKAKEDDKNVKDWGSGKGNHTPAYNAHDTALAQTDVSRKAKMVTPTVMQVQADLDKEKAHELVKPTQKADNALDAEPTNVQLKAEPKEDLHDAQKK